MFRITDEDQGEVGNFITELNEIKDKIDYALGEAHEKIAALNEQIQRYNNVLKNARDFRDGVVQSMHDHFDGEPEKWREGDDGEAYSSWLDEWESAELNSLDLVEQPEVADQEHAAVLDELPTEP